MGRRRGLASLSSLLHYCKVEGVNVALGTEASRWWWALLRVTFKIGTTSSVAPQCPVANHHMETMSAQSDLSPKTQQIPTTPHTHTRKHTHAHTQTDISLTHVNCIACQVTVNKIWHIPDVDVLFLPWGWIKLHVICMKYIKNCSSIFLFMEIQICEII